MSWKIRCQDTSLKRGVWRPGNLLILSDLPGITTYRIYENTVFLTTVFATAVSRGKNNISRVSAAVFLYRNSTVLDKTICTLEPDFPRYYENRLVFKNTKSHGTRLRYSTVREISNSLGILDPHYIPLTSVFFHKSVPCALVILDFPSLPTIYKHISHT